ncbi:MAG: prepilin-type N-terminal cleavage/methylation domain-containing protein [Bacillota bacterium]
MVNKNYFHEPNSHFRYLIIKDENGVSLVELLLAMVLLSLVLSLGYFYFSYSTKSFFQGENRAQLQQSLRIVADFITREVRLATEVEILDSAYVIPDVGGITNDDIFLFVNGDGRFERRNINGAQIIPALPGELNLALEFCKSATDPRLLGYAIGETNIDLVITTNVLVLNLDNNIKGVNEGPALRITK